MENVVKWRACLLLVCMPGMLGALTKRGVALRRCAGDARKLELESRRTEDFTARPDDVTGEYDRSFAPQRGSPGRHFTVSS